MHQQRRDIGGGHAPYPARLPHGPRRHLRQLLPRLHAQRGDGAVVYALGDLLVHLTGHLGHLPLLSLDETLVLDLDLDSLRVPSGQTAPEPKPVQHRGVHLGAAQELLQRERLPARLLRPARAGVEYGLDNLRVALHPRVLQSFKLVLHRAHLLGEHSPSLVVDQAALATDRGEPLVRVVGPEHEPVLRSARQHAVRLAQVLGAEVVDERSEVAPLPGQHQLRAVERHGRGVGTREQPLRRGLLVPRGAVDLPGEEETADLLRLQRVVALVRREKIVLDGVRGPQHVNLLQTWKRPQQRQLQALGQPGAESLHVNLRARSPLGFEEDLVRFFIREANDFVLDGRAVSRSLGAHPTAVGGRLVQVISDELVRRGGGAREVARHLLPSDVRPWVEREPPLVLIPGLRLEPRVVYASAVHSRGRPCLEPVRLEPQVDEALGEALGGCLPGASGG